MLPFGTLTYIILYALIQSSQTEKFQRLLQPARGTKMTMTPGLSMPSLQLNTIESGFSMKMPIAIKFPTITDVVQNLMLQVTTLNSTNKSDNLTISRDMQARINSRARFYKNVESSHQTFGKSCLLRAICEVAEVPFISSSTGLIGEIIDLLLTYVYFNSKLISKCKICLARLYLETNTVNLMITLKQKKLDDKVF